MSCYEDDSIDREEESGDCACKEAAASMGYDSEMAEECDNGVLECDECPWRGQRTPTPHHVWRE